MSSRRLQNVLEDEKLLRWKRVEDVFKTCLEDVFKTSWRPTNVCWECFSNIYKMCIKKSQIIFYHRNYADFFWNHNFIRKVSFVWEIRPNSSAKVFIGGYKFWVYPILVFLNNFVQKFLWVLLSVQFPSDLVLLKQFISLDLIMIAFLNVSVVKGLLLIFFLSGTWSWGRFRKTPRNWVWNALKDAYIYVPSFVSHSCCSVISKYQIERWRTICCLVWDIQLKWTAYINKLA